MAYLTQREVEKLETEILDGSWDKPFFNDIPEWECIAKYFGFTLKWDKTPIEEWTPRGRELKYYCRPKFKKGFRDFTFDEWDVHQIFNVYQTLMDENKFDDELKEAWCSLEQQTMLKALYRKINEILKS